MEVLFIHPLLTLPCTEHFALTTSPPVLPSAAAPGRRATRRGVGSADGRGGAQRRRKKSVNCHSEAARKREGATPVKRPQQNQTTASTPLLRPCRHRRLVTKHAAGNQHVTAGHPHSQQADSTARAAAGGRTQTAAAATKRRPPCPSRPPPIPSSTVNIPAPGRRATAAKSRPLPPPSPLPDHSAAVDHPQNARLRLRPKLAAATTRPPHTSPPTVPTVSSSTRA